MIDELTRFIKVKAEGPTDANGKRIALTPVEREMLRLKRLEVLQGYMVRAQDNILRLLIDAVQNAKSSASYWTTKLVEVKKLYKEIDLIFTTFSNKQIPESYYQGQDLAEVAMKRAGLDPGSLPVGFDQKTINALVDDTVAYMTNATSAGLGDVQRLFKAIQTDLLREEQINQAIARGLVEGTPQKIKSEITKALETQLIGEQKYVKAGSRNYKPSTYAEIVARTRTREAQSSGVISESLKYGVDTVQVSDHNTTTPECIPHEGQIYSISGATSTFPRLNRVPPFHPNCLHVLLPLPTAGDADIQRLKTEADLVRRRNEARFGEEPTV